MKRHFMQRVAAVALAIAFVVSPLSSFTALAEESAPNAAPAAVAEESSAPPAAVETPAAQAAEPTALPSEAPAGDSEPAVTGALNELVPDAKGDYSLSVGEDGTPSLQMNMAEDEGLVYDESEAARVAAAGDNYVGTIPALGVSVTKKDIANTSLAEADTAYDTTEEEALHTELLGILENEVITGEDLAAVLASTDAIAAAVAQPQPAPADEAAGAPQSTSQEPPATPETATPETATAETAAAEAPQALPVPEQEEAVNRYAVAPVPVSLEESDLSKITFLNGSGTAYAANSMDENAISTFASAQQTITVVTNDSFAVWVKDEAGAPLKDATVSIYEQSTYTLRTIQTTATGVALFTNLSGTHNLVLDIQCPGYHTQTTLNYSAEGGTVLERRLVKNAATAELYLRCADLDGLDILFETNTLNLLTDTDKLKMVFLLARTGEAAAFPRNLELDAAYRKESDSKTTYRNTGGTFTAGAYGTTTDTRMYTSNEKWAEQEMDAFVRLRAGEKLYLSCLVGREPDIDRGSTFLPLSIENAATRPWFGEFSLDLGSSSSFTVPKAFPAIGGSSLKASYLDVPVDFGILPDGSVFFQYGWQMSKTEKEDLQAATKKPGKAKAVGDLFEKLNKLVHDKVDALKESNHIIQKAEHYNCALTGSYALRAAFTVGGLFRYDSNSGKLVGEINGAVTVMGSGTTTIYAFIPLGPVVIPVYGGLSAALTGKASGAIGATVNPASCKDLSHFWNSLSLRSASKNGFGFDFGLSLSAYAGIGIHGLLCGEVQGTGSLGFYVGFDKLDHALAEGYSYPHFKGTAGYAVTLSATALFITGTYPLFGAKYTWLDTWAGHDTPVSQQASRLAASPPDATSVAVDIAAANEGTDETAGVDTYQADNAITAPLARYSTVTPVASGVLLDNQMQYAFSKGKTALFRLAAVNGTPTLVYSLLNEDGSLQNEVHRIDPNSNYKNVVEFYVASNKLQAFREDAYVYITMVCDGGVGSTVKERAVSGSSVVSLAINLYDNTIHENHEVVNNTQYKFGCVASGFSQYPVTAWRTSETYCASTQDTRVNMESRLRGSYYIQSLYSGSSLAVVDHHTNRLLTPTGWAASFLVDSPLASRTWCFSVCQDRFNSGTFQSRSSYFTLPAGTHATDWQSVTTNNRGDNALYVLMDGRLKRLNVDFDSIGDGFRNKMTASLTPVVDTSGGDIILPADSHAYKITYNFNTNHVQLITLAPIYEGEAETAVQTGSQVSVYALEHSTSGGVTSEKCHGPYTSTIDDTVSHIAAVYPANASQLNIVYAVAEANDNPAIRRCNLYQWVQPVADSQEVLDFTLDKLVLSRTDKSVVAQVSVKNRGSFDRNFIALIVTDQEGNVLKQLDKDGNPLAVGANGGCTYSCSLYSGETRVITVLFQPNSSWATGEQTITIATPGSPQQTGVANGLTVGASLSAAQSISKTFDTSRLRFSGDQTFIGGEAVVQLSLTNDSMQSVRSSDLMLLLLTCNDSDIAFAQYPLSDLMGDGELVDAAVNNTSGLLEAHSYNITLPLESVWRSPDENGDLRNIGILSLVTKDYLTSEDGKMIASMTLANPYAPVFTKILAAPSDLDGGTVQGTGDYLPGKTATLTATANKGFRFAGWLDENGGLLSSDATLLLPDVQADRNLTARFEEDGTLNKLTLLGGIMRDNGLTTVVEAMGDVALTGDTATVSADSYSSSYLVPNGDAVTLYAQPNFGNVFTGWYDESGALVSTLDELDYTVTKSQTITARFAEFTVTEPYNTLYLHPLDLLEVTVPEALAENESLHTPEKLIAAIKAQLQKQSPVAVAKSQYKIFDVADSYTLSMEGDITYVIPYPDGTNASYTFAASGLRKASGIVESPTVEKAADGLRVTFSAPVIIGLAWRDGATKTYRITAGGGSVQQGDSLSFESDIPFALFGGVMLDGAPLATDQYEALEQTSGTLMRLRGSCTAVLAAGSHTIALIAADGSATAAFTVTAKSSGGGSSGGDNRGNGGSESKDQASTAPQKTSVATVSGAAPATGDTAPLGIWILVLALSLCGLVLFGLAYARQHKKEK